MCGIYGAVGEGSLGLSSLRVLSRLAQDRGSDESGFLGCFSDGYQLKSSLRPSGRLVRDLQEAPRNFFMGHSRLVTNGSGDGQPIALPPVYVIHNGIVVNADSLWESLPCSPQTGIDSEVIAALVGAALNAGEDLATAADEVLARCAGTVNAAVAVPSLGKFCLITNNGSLYTGADPERSVTYFASEAHALKSIGCTALRQVQPSRIFDIPASEHVRISREHPPRRLDLLPSLGASQQEEALLEFPRPSLTRCAQCILPHTMPFIAFDNDGVCNYCRNYVARNRVKPLEDLLSLVAPYRRVVRPDVVVPFSGGRDSSFALHVAVRELDLTPVAYTYDWGMVTDLGRRNISRMCADLGVEHVIVAADIERKRENIRKNLLAWLKHPQLGMLSILTAGDKHFFKYVDTVKDRMGIDLQLWGINPLEVTHFKAGFLGIPPDFLESNVYASGWAKQLRYQYLRLGAMVQSPGYFNASLWDTLTGEYYRSIQTRQDSVHLFDYWRWDEKEVDSTLAQYDWETAPDTSTTWRIGDGTAAFYNYVYYTVAGFTEHDTFRSNQIREGQMTREEALSAVEEENRPRYPNLKWYLDAVGVDFSAAIGVVNAMPKLYEA